jgi:tRNA (cytidine/uridine-2'-O-)-methyltransferase
VLHLVLVEPEIHWNTGNLGRTALAVGAELHLVEPLGFSLDDKQLKRAGLDYHEYASIRVHGSWEACVAALDAPRLFAFSKRAQRRYDEVEFRGDDAFVFGAETSGLSPAILEGFPSERQLRLPMRPDNRSLNLSNAVAVVVYEAWRQLGFPGASDAVR